jgi:hypothetical protein
MTAEVCYCCFNLKREEGSLAYYLVFCQQPNQRKGHLILTLIDNNQQFFLNLKKVSC